MKIILSLLLGIMSGNAGAQVLSPVQWTFTSSKIAEKIYEIKLAANIQNGWHLYSQTQPANAINIPTAIIFNKNPLISLDGKARENGKIELYVDKRLGISANQYMGRVEFIQKLKLKTRGKTNISGTVEYQTCDDKKCLPPKKMSFNVALN